MGLGHSGENGCAGISRVCAQCGPLWSDHTRFVSSSFLSLYTRLHHD